MSPPGTLAPAPHWSYPAALSDYMAWYRAQDTLTADEVCDAINYGKALARIRWETRELPEITIELTEFQADEIDSGLDTDAADHGRLWGRVTRPVKGRPYLTVAARQEARDDALYRLTSLRDTLLDNSMDQLSTVRERRQASARGRSINTVVRRLIEAAGGTDTFHPRVRRYAYYRAG